MYSSRYVLSPVGEKGNFPFLGSSGQSELNGRGTEEQKKISLTCVRTLASHETEIAHVHGRLGDRWVKAGLSSSLGEGMEWSLDFQGQEGQSQDGNKKSRHWVVLFALTCRWGCLTNIYLWE